ncbi:hypothetical protein J5N97_000130 [Dioscorea zingiberensis]|uniref:Uncharacterized protein n=1 Tax=Dioscorea zingiberensis TaxID=325984 RepID=A0A9D5BSY6_9LILI|nr:hypothetical protein J5N97_000130 [Dioscorea zingiberensis]
MAPKGASPEVTGSSSRVQVTPVQNPSRSYANAVGKSERRVDVPTVIFPGPVLDMLRETITDSITVDPELLSRTHESMKGHGADSCAEAPPSGLPTSDGTKVTQERPIVEPVVPSDTGRVGNTTGELQCQGTGKVTDTSSTVQERPFGSWMAQNGYRGRGRGRGRGGTTGRGGGRASGRGGGRGGDRSPTTTHAMEEDHVPGQRSCFPFVDQHVIPQLPEVSPDECHVDTPIPDQPLDASQPVNLARGRTVDRSIRGSVKCAVDDDRLLTFVRKRSSRERSTDGSRGLRTRSRSNQRYEGGKRNQCPQDKGGTRGNSLLLSSMDDDDVDRGPRSKISQNNKGKGIIPNPLPMNHNDLIHRISQALAEEKAKQLTQGDKDEDEPPDYGGQSSEERNTSNMEAMEPNSMENSLKSRNMVADPSHSHPQ